MDGPAITVPILMAHFAASEEAAATGTALRAATPAVTVVGCGREDSLFYSS